MSNYNYTERNACEFIYTFLFYWRIIVDIESYLIFFLPLRCPVVFIAFRFVRVWPAEVEKRQTKIVNDLGRTNETEPHAKSHQT